MVKNLPVWLPHEQANMTKKLVTCKMELICRSNGHLWLRYLQKDAGGSQKLHIMESRSSHESSSVQRLDHKKWFAGQLVRLTRKWALTLFHGQSHYRRKSEKWKLLSHVCPFETPGAVAHQASLSMRFSKQEYWSGLPFTSPGDLLKPGIELRVSCTAGRFFTIWTTRKVHITVDLHQNQKIDNDTVFYRLNTLSRFHQCLHALICVCAFCCFSVAQSCLTFVSPWTAAGRHPCPLPSPGTCSNSCPLDWWCHPTIMSSLIPVFTCLQSFSASGPFLMSESYALGGQNIGASASASVLPLKIQDWIPLGLIDLISLQSKGLSWVFSNITVQ